MELLRARRVNAAAALLSLAVACRTPSAAARAAPASAPLAVETRERQAPSRAADDSDRLVVFPSGDAYLVLSAGPERLAPGAAWDVLYFAGYDAAVLARRDADAALSSAAHHLLDAFGPLAEIARAERLSVTAMFGKPGERGAVAQRRFRRDAGGWRADGAPLQGAIPEVPEMLVAVARDRYEEASARDAAAAFLSDVNRSDFDAAWARTSVLAKVVMSRTEFERRVASLRDGDLGRRDAYLAFPVPMERLLPGMVVEAWIARETAHGASVEALALRLDDDMEWRIAAAAKLVAAPEPPPPVRREVGPVERAASPY